MTPRPRRSALYMPGANAEALEKARTLDADVVMAVRSTRRWCGSTTCACTTRFT
jgi:hypothetical protein